MEALQRSQPLVESQECRGSHPFARVRLCVNTNLSFANSRFQELEISNTKHPGSIWAHQWCMHSARDREFCKQKEVQIHKAKHTGYNTQEEQETVTAKNGVFENAQQDTLILVATLKSYANKRDLHRGSRLHAYILQTNLLTRDIFVGTALVDMYAKCGAIAEAQKAFDELPKHDTVSWTALIAGYAHHGHGHEALKCFESMQGEGFTPNAFTFTSILKACAGVRDFTTGKQMHAVVVRQRFLEKDAIVGTALVDMYAKCRALEKAQAVFDELPTRNVVTWTAMIAGYTQHGCGHEALSCFKHMQAEGVSPNVVTFISTLKACANIEGIDQGKQIHAELRRLNLLDKHTLLCNALIDMYGKCGALTKAQKVFDNLHTRDVVSWSALIAGYSQHGYGHAALNCFERMQQEGFSPNAVTYASVLKACASVGEVERGQEIHVIISRQRLFGEDAILSTALVDMYARCGVLGKAQEVFDELPVRDYITWSALLDGYVQHEYADEALCLFEEMQEEGYCPNAVTYTCMLKACGSIGAGEKGKELHIEVVKQRLLEGHAILGNALVDMYARCGIIDKAHKLFDELCHRNVVSWSMLIAGYAQLGEVEAVLFLFRNMMSDGMEPDAVAFTVLLNACSHAGLADNAEIFFEAMSCYGIIPTLEHWTCMIDLFGRVGHLMRAVALMDKLPLFNYGDCFPVWLAFLGACRKWDHTMLGRLAFEHFLQLGRISAAAAAYISMSNMYAASSKLNESESFSGVLMSQCWQAE